MKQNSKFTHESLQDSDTIKSLLKAISNGIGKGKVQLEDEEGVLTLYPEGLMRLKITGLQDDDKNRLNIRITWAADNEIPEKKPIKVNSK
jgi:amphi-Trp domain-containing protein